MGWQQAAGSACPVLTPTLRCQAAPRAGQEPSVPSRVAHGWPGALTPARRGESGKQESPLGLAQHPRVLAAVALFRCWSLGCLLINVTAVIFSLPVTEAPLAWSSFSPWHPSRCPRCLPADVFVFLRHFMEPETWGTPRGPEPRGSRARIGFPTAAPKEQSARN